MVLLPSWTALAAFACTVAVIDADVRLSNLDLAGRTAHATAMLNKKYEAAAYLEAMAAELEPKQPRDAASAKRRPWGGASGRGSKPGHKPRATSASPTLRSAQGSSSGSGAWSGSGSGTPCRPSPMSSGGMESSGSIVESEDLSYEYCESDKE